MGLPVSGLASTYSDFFVNKMTSSGDIYTHTAYTAALLPRERWHAVPLGTKVQISFQGRSAVVKINDRGVGDGSSARVLDLSRAAYAYLAGLPLSSVTDKTAGVLNLQSILIVPPGTPTGPVKK